MKEEIKLWKEYKEDQEKRYKAYTEDPERQKIWADLNVYSYPIVKIYDSSLRAKYGIEDDTYENFMNWLAKDKPLFKGVEIKHEIIT